MSLVTDTIFTHLPYKRKSTPSGWVSFNAVCCNDKRNRGGLIQDGESVTYHCFNCGFKTSWQPGRPISFKMRKLLRLLNVDDEKITKLSIEALKLQDKEIIIPVPSLPKFISKTMPRGSKPIKEYLDHIPDDLIPVIEYIYSRNLTLDDYDFYWTPEDGFSNRLIIPYYYKNQIVGYTGRRIDKGEPKYLAEQQPGYVFNLDRQTISRDFVIVCEGQMDAISIDGISVMSNEISEAQALLIAQLHKPVIVVPDKDKPGLKLIESAIKYKYAVSFPDWDNTIKDINDSVMKYGRIPTLLNIVEHTYNTELQIKLATKKWISNEPNC